MRAATRILTKYPRAIEIPVDLNPLEFYGHAREEDIARIIDECGMREAVEALRAITETECTCDHLGGCGCHGQMVFIANEALTNLTGDTNA